MPEVRCKFSLEMCLTDSAAKHRLKVLSFSSTKAWTDGDLFSVNFGIGKIRGSFSTTPPTSSIP